MQLYHKWDGLRREIAEYCKQNGIDEKDFRFLNIYEWQNVYDRVLEHFVDPEYARGHGIYWANTESGFQKHLSRIYAFQEGVENNAGYEWIERFPEIVSCEKVYLLLEEDRPPVKYWAAECSSSVVHLIINEASSAADYYITDKKFNWIITENHHDVVLFIGKGLDADIIKSICSK